MVLNALSPMQRNCCFTVLFAFVRLSFIHYVISGASLLYHDFDKLDVISAVRCFLSNVAGNSNDK